MSFVTDCLTKYSCGEVKLPPEGAVCSPFVELNFRGRILTMGNSSSPPDNHAAIKSFEYGVGCDLGGGFKVEVIDEGGITYRRLIDALNKTVSLASDDNKNCSVKFGWVIRHCDGTVVIDTNEHYGKKLFFLPGKMETQFENGVIKLTFEGTSFAPRWAETRYTKTLGSQNQTMPLKQALRTLFTEYDPKVDNVKFLNKDGGELEFANSDGGADGPMGVWPMDQQNAPAVARKWIAGLSTKDGLGILMFYDPTGPSVVFQENPMTEKCCDTNFLGTYIVNGGNQSPVISFNPSINWPKGLGAAAGGSLPGAASGDNSNLIEPTDKEIEKVGSQTGPSVQQHEWMWRVPDDMAFKNADAIAAHLEANARYESKGPIEGELCILGRPDLTVATDIAAKYVSIIVINPFYISRESCSWITTSTCNSILSNKRWYLTGINHKISNGSFVTTLKVQLRVPNVTIPATDPLGGKGCGTETFENSQNREVQGT
ncbi:MAG: hypothetical protein EKK64_05790 [Neisseriaceae bacterium]|nr:MAG: hypothetical protein EKK64_05790 [Neisseriaceae bacterium]